MPTNAIRFLVFSLLSGAALAACGEGTNAEETSFDTSEDNNSDVAPVNSGGDAAGDAAPEDAPETSTDAADGSSDAGEVTDTSDTSDATDGSSDAAPVIECGNGILEEGEECDGIDLGDASCVSLDFLAGELSCDNACSFVTDACFNAECGNGSVDGDEACDDNNTDDGDGCSSICTTCIDDALEPNFDFENAARIVYPSTTSDLVAQANNDDWYRTFISPGCLLNFTALFEGDAGQLTIDVIDIDGETVLATGTVNDEGTGLRVTYSEGGDQFSGQTAFARVRATEAAACLPYTLVIDLICG